MYKVLFLNDFALHIEHCMTISQHLQTEEYTFFFSFCLFFLFQQQLLVKSCNVVKKGSALLKMENRSVLCQLKYVLHGVTLITASLMEEILPYRETVTTL